MPITISIITGIITATTTAGTGISKAQQEKLKRKYEQNLRALEFDEQKKLEKELVEAKSLEERKKLLAETLGKATEARIQSIEQKKLEQQKNI